jgi:hypothetical protein
VSEAHWNRHEGSHVQHGIWHGQNEITRYLHIHKRLGVSVILSRSFSPLVLGTFRLGALVLAFGASEPWLSAGGCSSGAGRFLELMDEGSWISSEAIGTIGELNDFFGPKDGLRGMGRSE